LISGGGDSRLAAPRYTVSLLIVPLLAGGCGYQLGYRSPPAVVTVAVPIFDNVTFPLRRDIEYELTRAVRNEIQARSALRLVRDRDADMILYGRITDFQESVIAEGQFDEKLESTIRVSVDVVVEDYVNRQVWRKTVRDLEPFSASRGETIDSARSRAIDNLAEKIVLAIEAW
jgi:hypothetical protein